MRFDPLSFITGFLTSLLLSLGIWRYRARLAAMQQSTEAQIEGTRRFFGQPADVRYHRDLLRYLQRRHIAGDVVELGDVLLEPRLIEAPAPITPLEEGAARDVFDVVPLHHDMPHSYAPFNIKTFALEELGLGDRHIAILGISGLGKSTALATLAMIALGEVEFESFEDLSEQAIREQEEGLSDEERKRRAHDREQVQERALERLHTTRSGEQEQILQADKERLPPLTITDLVPLLVDIRDLEFDVTAYGKSEILDPSEPLIRAVQRQVSTVTARMVGSVLYPALERGRALILLDGYDDLSPEARETYFYWLQHLLAEYGHNLIVIAGPVTGYDPLLALGFTPTFLRAWREQDYDLLAKRWAAAWAARGKGKQRLALPDEQALRRISVDNRGRVMLDVILKIWTGLADDARETGRSGWYDALINRRLTASGLRGVLGPVAAHLLNTGKPIDRAALLETIAQVLSGEGDSKTPKPESVVETLAKDGILVPHAHDSFGFPHSQITSYFAAEVLAQPGSEMATDLAMEPAWQDALAFAAARINMLPVIYRKLSVSPDLLYSALFGLVRWVPDSAPDAPWRGDLFKRWAAAMIAPQQYPVIRERAMAALIESRDKNVLFVLRDALRAANPDVRRLSCIALGALGDSDAIRYLAPMLGDNDRDVQLAAGLALGAIGTEHALEVMVEGLLRGSDQLRRAVAEALAAIPGEGHSILRDGIKAEEIDVRRASVFGLSRINASWALVALYRAMLEDEQWYVRTAAEEAFLAVQSSEREGPRAHPEADTLVWLIQWAANRGEGVPAGENSRQVLVQVLQEGEPPQKSMAALTLGRLGHVPALKPLYAALRDRDPGVRGAAFAALAAIQLRLGEGLPGVA